MVAIDEEHMGRRSDMHWTGGQPDALPHELHSPAGKPNFTEVIVPACHGPTGELKITDLPELGVFADAQDWSWQADRSSTF